MPQSTNMTPFDLKTPKKGSAAGLMSPNTQSVMVDPQSVATLVPGDAVKLTGNVNGVIYVDKCTVVGDAPYGLVHSSTKGQSFTAGLMMEIDCDLNICYAEAGGVINPGDVLCPVAADHTLIASDGSMKNVAYALGKATAAGQIIAVSVRTAYVSASVAITGTTVDNTPIGGSTAAAAHFTTLAASGATALASTLAVTGAVTLSNVIQGPASGFISSSKRVRVTLAQANAGYTLLAALTGLKYRLHSARITAIGASAAHTANATGVAITGTQTTPVALVTVALAGLTRSTLNGLTTANTTLLADGASFVACDVTTAVTFAAVGGTDLITATAFDVDLEYSVEA